MIDCTFGGSYSDPMPWAEQACMADQSVPAGCPFHFVTAVNVMPAQVTVTRNDTQQVPATTTLVDTSLEHVAAVDVYSCTCDRYQAAVTFQRFEVAAPSLQAGDVVSLEFPGLNGPPVYAYVGPAAPCPAVTWPTNYIASIACDLCPTDGSGSGSGSGSGGIGDPWGAKDGGCAVGGGAPAAGLAIAMIALIRRRRSRI